MRLPEFFREHRPLPFLREVLLKRYGLINMALFLLFLRILMVPFIGDEQNYRVGDIAGEDIRAPRDVQYVDVSRTEFKLRGIRRTIPPVFSYDESRKDVYASLIERFIRTADEPENRTGSLDGLSDRLFRIFGVRFEPQTLTLLFRRYKPAYWGPLLKRVSGALSGISWFDRNREFFRKLEPYGIIRTGDMEEERINPLGMKRVIFTPPDRKHAEDLLQKIIRVYHPVFRRALVDAALSIGGPNVLFDKERTRIYEKNILGKVAPEMQLLKKEEIVVRRGDRITRQQFEKLRALNIKRETSLLSDMAGYGLALLLLVILVVGYLSRFFPQFYLNDVRLRIVLVFFVFLNTIMAILFRGFSVDSGGLPYGVLLPVAISSMAVTLLFNERLSYFMTLVFALFVTVVSKSDFMTFFMVIGAGGIAARASVSADKRTDLWRAGLIVTAFLILALFSDFLLKKYNIAVLMKGAGIAFLNGILSSIIAVGLIPFLESFLRVPTRFKLLELADTNSPLLKQMQIEATGTYTHSIIVGNLAESAAASIGANALLARVGSYYHDIGKIGHAPYFSENQQGMENKHKDLKPSVSRSVLIAHVRKGVDLARREGLPQMIVDFIEQHHGTSVMKFFYHQALDTSEQGIRKDDFRYPGPRPQTKETAIVMLADSVEAATKSLKDPTPQRIDTLVTEIIRSRFLDGELDESTLTLRDLRIIARSFTRILNSLFHSRVEYPEEDNIKEAEAIRKKQNGRKRNNGQ